MFKLSATFLLVSGIASLTYQVTWVRLLGLSMGSTTASISTVLAAFFLGLALGSYLAERITRNRIHNLTPYIYLELIIGLSGIVLLPVLLNLDSLMAMMPALGTMLSFKFVIAMALLCIPTLCMGATFPVMASIMIRTQSEMGLRMSQLYSLNTAGAVLGACMSGFVFIPNWGLDGAIYIAFVLNMLIVMMGVYFNRNLHLPAVAANPEATSVGAAATRSENAPLRKHALLVLFFTGLVAIATEVGWTKFLVIFAGTTIYGFAAILTIFLIGIALGSWVIRSYLEKIRSPQKWMAIGLILLGIALLFTRAGLSTVPAAYEAINHLPAPAFVVHGVKYVFIFSLLLLPTFLFGALFPLNLKLYCGDLTGVRARIGKAYAVNTLASIIGSILAGFWFIPKFGTDVLLTVMALVILVLPFIFIPSLKSIVPRTAVALFALLGIFVSWALPHLDYKQLIASVDYKYDDDAQAGKKPEFLFLKEGKAGVVSVVTYDKEIAKVQNNGLNESMINMEDPHKTLLVESLLGLVPYFLHEDPKAAFVVGFGGGITTRALTYTKLESIRVVELEPAVVDAGRAIAGGEIPALQDQRVRIDFNDARNTLLVEDKTYDIIAAQPSHPWRAGAANVFTYEFFEIVHSRLNPGGIYAQWVNLFNMDVTTLQAIFKAFFSVFPEGVTFANLETGDFLLFGSDQPLIFNYQRIMERMDQSDIKATLANYGVYNAEDLLWYFALSRREALNAAEHSVPNTDTNILSEVRLSALVNQPTGDEDPYAFLRKHFKYDVSPYFPEDEAVDKMFGVAQMFVRWDSFDVAEKIVKQLEGLDALRARVLEYEVHWSSFEIFKAIDLYRQHEKWPDSIHQKQVEALTELGRLNEAESVAKRIENKNMQNVAEAYILYMKKDWDALAQLQPENDDARKWQLLGLAKQNLNKAGGQLSELIPPKSQEIPQLKILVGYFGAQQQFDKMEQYARQLVRATSRLSDRLSKFAEKALEENNPERAEVILKKLERINPQAEKLPKLRDRLSDMVKADTKKV